MLISSPKEMKQVIRLHDKVDIPQRLYRSARRLVGVHGTLNTPETRGRKPGFKQGPRKPDCELSQNPKTAHQRARNRALPDDERELNRRKNADANARHALRESLKKPDRYGNLKYPEYAGLVDKEKNAFFENKWDEVLEQRFRSEKSGKIILLNISDRNN